MWSKREFAGAYSWHENHPSDATHFAHERERERERAREGERETDRD